MGSLSRDVTVKKYIHERYSLMPSDTYRSKCSENQNFSDWSIVFLEHFFVKTHGERVCVFTRTMCMEVRGQLWGVGSFLTASVQGHISGGLPHPPLAEVQLVGL